MATYTASANGGKILGTTAADQIYGLGGNDTISSGAGDDLVYGGGGRDMLSGQDGSDTLDGNAGNDTVDGGAGTDLLIYRLAENAGSADLYIGGQGVDTLRLELTAAEWASARVQSEVARYVTHLANVARTNGEVALTTGDFTFDFGNGTTLKVQMTENLLLSVDGQVLDTYNAPRVTAYTNGALGEDDGSGLKLSTQGSVNFTDFDLKDTHSVSVAAVGGNTLGGSVTGVIADAATGDGFGQVVWTYNVDRATAQRLGAGETAVERFNVTVTDSSGRSVTQVVTVTVTGANDAPVLTSAQATLAQGAEDTAYTVTLTQLLTGFADAEGSVLSVTNLTADHGTAVRNADGSWTITPAANYNGPVTLSYGVSDGTATTAATLGLTLAAVNDAPALTTEQATLAAGTEDTAYTVAQRDLLQGFSDVDSSTLSVTDLTADHGTAVRNNDGSWTITPAANYNGPITLSYGVSDGTAVTAATLGLSLAAVNDAPALTSPQVALAGTENAAFTVTQAQLLQGFSDVEGDALSVTTVTADHGTAERNADGSWTITPAADYNGTLTLSYGVSDGLLTTAATLSLTLASINHAPVLTGAQATLAQGTEDTSYTVTLSQLTEGFTDRDGDALSVTNLSVDHGTAVRNANGSWTITPTPDYTGPVKLSYGVSDGKVSTPATLDLTLVAANDAPTLTGTPAQLSAGSEDTVFTVTSQQLLQGFTDADGDAMSVTGLTVDHGTAVRNEDGSWTITPAANYHGSLALIYAVSDGKADTVATPALLIATLGAVNDAPALTGAQASVQAVEDTAFSVTLSQLLQGFADVDSEVMSITGVTVDHGTAVEGVNGSWIITPDANYNGPLKLSYGVSDGAATTQATLVVAVAAINDAPALTTAQAQLANGTEDTAFTVQLSQLLQGFSDVDGDTLSVSSLSANHGSAVRNGDGSWTITPSLNYNGPLTLTYNVSDGRTTTQATLDLSLAAVNDAPKLVSTAALPNGAEDTPYVVTLAQLLQNHADPEGDAMSVSNVRADHGTVVQNADGTWTVTPAANYRGWLQLSYDISDGALSTAATANAFLVAVNHAPALTSAQAQLANGTEDTAFTVQLSQLLQGFSDVDGDTLSVPSLSVNHGTVVRNGDGSWTITPASNYNGPLTLTYSISDGRTTTQATLDLSLAAVNDAPKVVSTAALPNGAEDTPYVVTLAQLLQNYADPEGDAMSVSNVSANHGTVVQNADGTWTVTPDANYRGWLQLSYTVSDGQLSTAATANAFLVALNHAPALTSAQAQLANGTEDTAFTVQLSQLLQGFSDADGDTLSVSSLSANHGSAVRNGDGSWTITPSLNYNGPLTLTYSISDGRTTTQATLDLSLAAVNDVPVYKGGTATTSWTVYEDQSYTVTQDELLQDYRDPDGDTLSVTQLTVDSGATVVKNADGTWTITPDANFNGNITLRYGVTDGLLTKDVSLVQWVRPVNDAPALTGTQATLADGIEDEAFTVTRSQLLQGFSDVEGGTLSVTGLSVDHGWAVVKPNGDYLITPHPDYNGPLTLNYGVADSGGLAVAGSLSLTLAAANDAPALTGTPATLQGVSNTPYTVTQAQLLQGFTDPESNAMSLTELTVEAHGSAVQNADGSWTITPEAGYTGPLKLSYGVSDGELTKQATLVLDVADPNEPPVFVGGQATLANGAEDTSYTVLLADLVQGFEDPNGDTLSVPELTVDHGTAVRNEDGSWTITPAANYAGALTLSYTVSDGKASVAASLDLALDPVNDAPALTESQSTLPNGIKNTDYIVTRDQLVAGFSDVDGDTLSVDELTVDHGSAVRNDDGSWTITPEADYTGAVTLTYSVNDGQLTASATLSLSVLSANVAPELTGDQAVLAEGSEDTAYTVTQAELLQGFTDANVNDTLSVTALTVDQEGATVLHNEDGSWTITPAANYHGPLTLSYTVSDGELTTQGTLGLSLGAVNDAPALTESQAVLEAGTENQTYVVSEQQLLQGFSDVETDQMSVTALTLDHGTAERNDDGSWTITPEGNYNGTVVLTYSVSDGAATTQGTLALALAGVNYAPELTDPQTELAEGSEDTSYDVTLQQLVQGFTDADGDMLSVPELTVDHGTAEPNGNGGWTITPSADYNGPLVLSYKVSDGTVATDATLALTLAAVNDAPALTDTAAELTGGAEDESYTVSEALLLQGFSDVESDAMSVADLSVEGDLGTALRNADGSWTITPNADYNGTLTLVYRVSDGQLLSTETRLNLPVAAVNDAPALTGTATTLGNASEDTAYTVSQDQLLAGFTDADSGDTLSVTELTVDHGTALRNDDGSWTITFEAEYNGPTSLNYVVSDGTTTVQATLALAVDAVNDAPAVTDARAELADGTEDTSFTVTSQQLLKGFSDVEGEALSAIDVAVEGGHGTVQPNEDGTWTVTPEADYNGTLTLTYKVSDGTNATDAALSVTLAAVNDAPVLVDGQAGVSATEDTAFTVTLEQLLQGFRDVDNDVLSVTGLTVADGQGTVQDNGDGSWTITPAADYNGTLTLGYVVADGTVTVPATLALSVAAVNDAPVLTGTQATPDTGAEDSDITLTREQLLQGFSDVDGNETMRLDGFTIEHATVSYWDGNTLVLSPEANYNGPLTLNYVVGDSELDASNGVPTHLDLTLAPINDAPALTGTAAELAEGTEDTAYTVAESVLLQGFTDLEDNPMSVIALTVDGDLGTAVRNSDGSWTITPAADHNGPLTLRYSVSDGELSAETTLSLTLGAFNDAPVLTGTPAAIGATEDTTLTVTQAQLLEGFTDVDGDTLSVTALTVDHGTVTSNEDGSWTVTLPANYHGPLTLIYGVNDSAIPTSATQPATLELAVTPVNDAPELTGTAAMLANGTEDNAFTVSKDDLLQGITDVDGDKLSVTGVTVEGDHGTAVCNEEDGSWTITPTANYSGPLTLRYTVSDGQAAPEFTLSLALAAVNDAPALTGTPVTLDAPSEDTAFTVTQEQLLQGFTDVDPDDALSVSGLTVNDGHGTAVHNEDGSWTITPAANYHGALTLSYGVSDGTVSTPATLEPSVTSVNDAPVLTGVQTVLAQGTENVSYPVTLEQLVAGFTDVDGDTLSVSDLTVDNDLGTAVRNDDGSWTITPKADFNGTLTLSYGVSDGTVSVPATLSLTLDGANSAPAITGPQATLANGAEDAAYTVELAQLLEGITDPDGDTLSVDELTVEHGTAVHNANGSWTITPEANYNGALTLSYVVNDGVDSVQAALGLTLDPVNDAPTVDGEPLWWVQPSEDTPVTVTLGDVQYMQQYGFVDVDHDALTLVGITVDHGTVVHNDDGSWTITPPTDYNGPLTLSYGMSDGTATTWITVDRQVAAVNDAPALTGEAAVLASATEDTSFTVTVAELLQGFTDVESDGLSVRELKVHDDLGTVKDNGDGTWTITPAADLNGTLTLDYGVSDGTDTTWTSLGVTVAAVNDAPARTGDVTPLQTDEDVAFTVSTADLLQGYTDVDAGDSLSVTGLTVENGTAHDNGDGTWTITPDLNFHGTLVLGYGVSDGTVTTPVSRDVPVASVNDAPVLTGMQAVPDAGTEDSDITLTREQLLQGFSDVDGNETMGLGGFSIEHATVSSWDGTTLVLTPEANYNGPLTLNYVVGDNELDASNGVPAHLDLTLAAVNDAPARTGDAPDLSGISEDTPFTVSLLQGFTDADNDSMSVTGLTVENGTAQDNGGGSWLITPDLDFDGTLVLSYGVSDGTETTPVRYEVNVASVNDAPVLTGTQATLDAGTEDTQFTVTKAQLLQGFTDADGNDTFWVGPFSIEHASWEWIDNGSAALVTPEANYNGPLTVDYRVDDGEFGVPATLTLTLAAVNDAPARTGDAPDLSDISEDTPFTVSLLQGYTDADGDSMSVTGLTVENGTAQDNGDGSWLITPDLDFHGTLVLSYGVSDGTETTAVRYEANVASVNDVPEVTGPQATLADGTEDTSFTVSWDQLMEGITDVDGKSTLWLADMSIEHAQWYWDGSTLSVTPEANYNGLLTLNYVVGDEQLDASNGVHAQLTLTLAAANDAPQVTGDRGTLPDGYVDEAYNVPLDQLLAGITDADGDSLSVSNVTVNDGHGMAELNGDGNWIVTPEAGYEGTITLAYEVTDGQETLQLTLDTHLTPYA